MQEEEDDVERHEFGAFWALLAFLAALEKEAEIRERIVCYRDTYRLHSWALFNLHKNCTSALISGCLKLITVHFSMEVIFAEPKDKRMLGRKVDVLLMGGKVSPLRLDVCVAIRTGGRPPSREVNITL